MKIQENKGPIHKTRKQSKLLKFKYIDKILTHPSECMRRPGYNMVVFQICNTVFPHSTHKQLERESDMK